MELNEYQKRAMATCMPSCDNFAYMMLNLVGEVGELASKAAKAIRKGMITIGDDDIYFVPGVEYGERLDRLEEYKKEAGDILWQLAGLCHAMGWSLEEIAEQNLAKLASRQQRGVIEGNGDNR